MLREYELPFARKEGSESIAGDYAGHPPETLFKYLTNPDEYEIDDFGKISIFECKCGCEGCWPMKVKVRVENEIIFWTDFEQPHRTIESHNYWNYSDFRQLEFDKKNYNEQLIKLKQSVGK